MRQLILEFSLEVLSELGFPTSLLSKSESLRFLRQDTYGFQISFNVQASQVSSFKKTLMEQNEAVRGVEKLSRANTDGLETLLIRGRWLSRNGSVNSRSKAAKTLRSLSASQKYLLKRPEIVGEKLRLSIEGKESEIRMLLARIDRLKVPYNMA